jgi:ABC-type glycerol-3-phosphate transport system permease component
MAQASVENTGLGLVARYAVLVLVSFVFALPLVFMVVSSLKPDNQLLQDTSSAHKLGRHKVGDTVFANCGAWVDSYTALGEDENGTLYLIE